MERIYIEYDMAKFTRKDITLVDVELYDGRSFQNLEPRRLFPVSGLEKYITLLDETGAEKAIIRDLRTLPPEERKTVPGACAPPKHSRRFPKRTDKPAERQTKKTKGKESCELTTAAELSAGEQPNEQKPDQNKNRRRKKHGY